MTRVLLRAWVLSTLLALATSATAHPQVGYTAADTLDAIDQASVEYDISWHFLYRVVGCETGWTFNPYVVGKQRELGPVQLHPRGELPRFFRYGNSDPFNPHESVRYLALRTLEGAARAWTCA